ncbi:hypothetical protein BH24ACI3_BH24ACI3_09410 [soil metagenome]
MRSSLFTFAAFTFGLLIFTGVVSDANAQGRRPAGAGPPAGTPRGGGPPAGIPAGGGVDRGIGTASQRSGGRSDQGLGRASTNSGGRSDAGLNRARNDVEMPSSGELNRYRGIANRFNTSPEEMRDRYLSAAALNPDLKFGQFVAAHVVASNLSARYPNVSAPAILSGLSSGNNLGQTLRMLGVGENDVREAPKTASRQIRESRKRQ